MTKVREKSVPHDGHLVNEYVVGRTLYVIGADGENLGALPRKEAEARAQEAGLDMVQVGERDGIPVVKIMDFGKFIYAKKKQSVKAKKSQKVIQVKEIKMRPKIGPGDYQTKMAQSIKFLEEGKRVKFTLQFRGRQPVSIREVGTAFFDRITNDLRAQNVGQLVEEKEVRSGNVWSKVFYLKD